MWMPGTRPGMTRRRASPQPRQQLSPGLLQTLQPRQRLFIRLKLSEPQADAGDAPFGDMVHDQRNLAERQHVARAWRTLSMLCEMIGQCGALLLLRKRQPVD